MTGDGPFTATTPDDARPTSIPEADADDTVEDGSLPVAAPQPGHLGFTLRELILAGAWILAFALSFVPGAGSVLDSAATVWTMNGAWILTIGIPTAAVFLVVLRRLSPEGIRRVGSLGIDQFASVAFSVALIGWATLLWQQLDLVSATRRSALSTWPLWLEIVLMFVLVAVTVFAALIPGVRDDFEERTETLAHRNANPVRPVFTRPRPVRARGSVSDPQNEDDVDPGLLHEGEVGAADHLSAGPTGASVPGAAGYVPKQHRESFQASEAPSDEARHTVPAPSDDAPSDDVPAATITGAAFEAGSDVSVPSTESVSGGDGSVPHENADRREDEAETEESGSDTDANSADEPHASSDTLTEVLGDLLVPSPVNEVATHAVDVVADPGDAGRDEAGPRARSSQPQPFWALAPEKRAVHDARGDEIFTIGPEAWILVLEDRGGAYVVRHDDGRVGYLHDTENMTRG